MTKITATRLHNLAADETSLAQMRAEISALEEDFGALRAARVDGNPVSGGGDGHSDSLDNNIQQRTYLAHRIAAVQKPTESLRKALDTLTPEQRRVLDVFFVHKLSKPEERIAEEMNCDERTAWRKRSEALNALARVLYGGLEV